MKNVHIVYGLNFGDEGKGLVTDHLVRKHANSIVIRNNGGAQAGHTVCVQKRDGLIRHVFSHFGSGSLAGAPTFLGKEFVSNPILFRKEYERFETEGINPAALPNVFVHPASIITTPWDMIANQKDEDLLGDNRHGSCGVGIWHTMKRNESIPFYVSDLIHSHHEDLFNTCKQIIAFYGMRETDDVINKFIDDLIFFLNHVCISVYKGILKNFDNIIFENAQGLMLDKNYGIEPHTTPSNTGIVSALRTLDDWCPVLERDIYTYGVTRAYTTRHGAGPLPGEYKNKKYFDDTNLPHPYQGTLRFGPLDLNRMKELIDQEKSWNLSNRKDTIVITHLDQVSAIDTLEHGVFGKNEIHILMNHLDPSAAYLRSIGPTSDDVCY